MPGRVSVTIDGTKFNTIETVFTMSAVRPSTGMRVPNMLQTKVHVWVDLFDDQNFPFNSLKKMFDLANVPNSNNCKEIKLEFWKDDQMQDVICSYKFTGWISTFKVYNPIIALSEHPMVTDAADRVYNHVLHMELEPVLNTDSRKDVTISN
jgi:hypothetical protein